MPTHFFSHFFLSVFQIQPLSKSFGKVFALEMCKHFKSSILFKYFYDNQKQDSICSTRQHKPFSVDKSAFDNDYIM